MLKHPVTGQFIPAAVNAVPAHVPIVIGGPAPVSAPTSHGPLSQPGDVSDYERAEIVKEAAIRSTTQGGSLTQNAEQIAKERRKTLDPSFNPLSGL